MRISSCVFPKYMKTFSAAVQSLDTDQAQLPQFQVYVQNNQSTFHYRTVQPSGGIYDSTVVIRWKTLLKTFSYLQYTNMGDFNSIHTCKLSPTCHFHAPQRQYGPWWVITPTGIRFCTASTISRFNNMLPTYFLY